MRQHAWYRNMNIEIIIVDDGSNDTTIQIINKYMKKKIFGGSLDKYLILYNKYINLYATQLPLLNKE